MVEFDVGRLTEDFSTAEGIRSFLERKERCVFYSKEKPELPPENPERLSEVFGKEAEFVSQTVLPGMVGFLNKGIIKNPYSRTRLGGF